MDSQDGLCIHPNPGNLDKKLRVYSYNDIFGFHTDHVVKDSQDSLCIHPNPGNLDKTYVYIATMILLGFY